MFFYLHETLDFLYGLPLVVAASIIWLHPGRRSWIALERSLGLFGWFALLHGIGEWVQMWMLFHAGLLPAVSTQIREGAFLLVLVSNAILFFFARRVTLFTLQGRSSPIPAVMTAYAGLSLLTMLGFLLWSGDVIWTVEYVSRPLFLFPSGLLLAFSLKRYYEREHLMMDALHAKRFLRLAGISFLAFAFVAGLIPDPAVENCGPVCESLPFLAPSPLFVLIDPLRILLVTLIIAGLLGMVRVAGTELERRVQETLERLRSQEERLRTMAETDALTGAANRLKLMDALQEGIAERNGSGSALSLVLFDIDKFKRINDTHGHIEGDRVLVRLVQLCRATLPDRALFARMGGEEFCILMPAVPLPDALNFARELRAHLAGSDFGLERPVTCSFGVTHFRENESVNSFFQRADRALYRAKRNGRNRVESAGK